MTPRFRKLVAAAAAVVLTVSACGGAGGAGGDSASGERNPGDPSAVAGFDGSTIRLGVLGVLSGPVAVIGEPMTRGQEVWFDYLNSQGGVAGKYQVELVEEDTQFSPDEAIRQYNKIKGDVVAFAQVAGTSSTNALLPILQEDGMLAVAGSLDSSWVREENLLPWGVPYQIQAINAVQHYLDQHTSPADSTICTMGQDDVVGDAVEQGVEYAADQHGIEIANEQRFVPGTENLTAHITALRDAGCDMVFLGAAPGDAGAAWGAAAQAGYTPQWYALNASYASALTESPISSYLQEHVIIVGEGTGWGDKSVPGMREMLANVERYAPDQKPDDYFTIGYVMAQAMTAVLEMAVELGDLSPSGLLEASEQLGKVSFGGLLGDYRYGPAEDRSPPRVNTMFAVDPGEPFGLAVLQQGVTSDAAKSFEFE